MKSYLLYYPKLEGIEMPKNREEEIANGEKLRAHHERIHEQICAAGALTNITVHSQQLAIGTACISGSDEAIQRLKAFLQDSGLGDISDNFEFQLSS